ncbi:hypothetical protein ACFCY8_11495 [Streptomyces noursei]|uniref:hypothetical protein n=1 Tax=Streptomyces noursei TaxID=1971 RepID=UPI0035E1033B
MAQFEVIATRTEVIRFVILADSAEDAEERYLMDGDETDSKTAAQLRVTRVARVDAGEPTLER